MKRIFTVLVATAMLYPLSASSAIQGDINDDGRIDASEAIFALQVTAGLYPEVSTSCLLIGKGDWSTSTAYVECDVVSSGGESYVCKTSHTSSATTPDNDTVNWDLLSLKGDDGEQGIQGKPGYMSPGYFFGLISATPYEDCLINEEGFMCDNRQNIIVGVPLHSEAIIDVKQVEETISIEFTSLPLPDGSGYEIAVLMSKGVLSHNFTLAPDYPNYAISQSGGGFQFRASLVTDSQVAIQIDADSVKNFSTESLGVLGPYDSLPPWSFEWSDEGDQDITLHVPVSNLGDLRTNYVVTVEDLGGGMNQATAQWVTLSPTESFTFDFELHNPNGFPSVPDLEVQLWSPTVRLYDSFETKPQ